MASSKTISAAGWMLRAKTFVALLLRVRGPVNFALYDLTAKLAGKQC
jgi:hypothetical protein